MNDSFVPIRTIEDLKQVEKEINDAYLAQVRYDLDGRMRQHCVDWSHQFSDEFVVTVYGAVNGAWDDVEKDIERGRITLEDSVRLLDKFLECKLIGPMLHDAFLERFKQRVPASQEHADA